MLFDIWYLAALLSLSITDFGLLVTKLVSAPLNTHILASSPELRRHGNRYPEVRLAVTKD